MYYLISILIIITCVLLTLIVMIQNSKGGGLAADFSSSGQAMGVRKTNDILEKGTWTLAGVLLFLSLASNIFIDRGEVVQQSDTELQEQLENNIGGAPAGGLPTGGTQQPPAGGEAPAQNP